MIDMPEISFINSRTLYNANSNPHPRVPGTLIGQIKANLIRTNLKEDQDAPLTQIRLHDDLITRYLLGIHTAVYHYV